MQAIIVRDKDLDSERQCHAIHASRKWRVQGSAKSSPQIRVVLLDRTENFFQKSTFTEQNWHKTGHIS